MNAPKTQVKEVDIHMFVDSDHAREKCHAGQEVCEHHIVAVCQ